MIVNLTPHPIHVYAPDTPDVVGPEHKPLCTIPPCGTYARITTTRTLSGTIAVGGWLEVPLVDTTYGEVEGLPDPEPGVFYLVSLACATELRHSGRDDLIVVDRPVRNSEGTVVGARGFGRVAAQRLIGPAYD
ncbi:MAG TPA: hypothetical protein VIK92_02235 [Thermaerobacter sp.]